MHYCEICRKEEASLVVSLIFRGQQLHLHVCSECSNECRINYTVLEENNLTDYIRACLNLSGSNREVSEQARKMRGLRCPSCGLSGETVAAVGKMGCPTCYQTFQKFLAETLVEDDMSFELPHSSGDLKSRKRRLELLQLQRRLEAAVAVEAYEEAAHLRDQINSLKARDQGDQFE